MWAMTRSLLLLEPWTLELAAQHNTLKQASNTRVLFWTPETCFAGVTASMAVWEITMARQTLAMMSCQVHRRLWTWEEACKPLRLGVVDIILAHCQVMVICSAGEVGRLVSLATVPLSART